jgi:flagellar protein FlaG
MESYASAMGSELNFKLDEKNNVLQVEVIDPATDKVIRKIPPDELLNLANSLEKATAVMINRMF